jgi:hypothetical protein
MPLQFTPVKGIKEETVSDWLERAAEQVEIPEQ